MMHTLHLIAADRSRPANVARGIRDCLRMAGWEGAELAQTVEELTKQAVSGEIPLGLVESPDERKVQAAARALFDSSRESATGGIDLTDAQLDVVRVAAAAAVAASTDVEAEADEPDPDIAKFTARVDLEDLSMEAINTAMLMLSQTSGNVLLAYGQARQFARTTGQEDLWAVVCRLYVTSFDIGFEA